MVGTSSGESEPPGRQDSGEAGDADPGIVAVIGGFATSSLVFRTPPEFLGPVETLLEGVVALVSRVVVTDTAGIGWALGWLTLFILVFHIAPYLFPTQLSERTAGIPFRLALAGSSVLLGVAAEVVLFETALEFGTSPLDQQVAPVALVGTLVLFVPALYLPPYGAGLSVFARPDESLVFLSAERREQIGVSGFLLRSLLVAAAVGIFLAATSMLSPLVELLIIGIAVHDIVRYTLFRRAPPERRDIEERFALGSVAAWGNRRDCVVLLYALAIVLSATIAVAFVTTSVVYGNETDTRAEFIFAVVPTGAIALYSILYSVRVLVRLPFTSGNVPDNAVSEVSLPARPAGLFVPVGVTVGVISIVNFVSGTPDWLVGLTVAASVVTVGCSLWSFPRPLPLGDEHTLPLGLFLGFLAGIAVEKVAGVALVGYGGLTVSRVANEAFAVGLVGLLVLSPYLAVLPGFVSLDEPFDGFVRAWSRLAVAFFGFILWTVGGFAVARLVENDLELMQTLVGRYAGDILGQGGVGTVSFGLGVILAIATLVSAVAVAVLLLAALFLAAVRTLMVFIWASRIVIIVVRQWLYEGSAVSELDGNDSDVDRGE